MPRAIHRSKAAIALYLVVAAALLAVVLTVPGGQVQAQSGLLPPPLPMLIGGDVTVGGQAAPDGISIVSRMVALDGDKYQSGASITNNGRYKNLKVAPPDIKYQSQQVTFHIIAVEGSATAHLDEEGLTARESFFFGAGAQIQDNFTLTFAAIPPAPPPTHTPTPTATATATPTNTPVPEDTPTPEPTNTPEPTPTNTPEPTATPAPTSTPTATPTPEPTPTPTATALPPTPIILIATPTPGPGPTPEPEGPGTCGQGSRPDAYVLLAGLGLIGLVWMRRRRDGRA